MFRGAETIAVSLRGDAGRTAALTVQSASLSGGEPGADALSVRFERIVTGLARQLRSTIDKDLELGCYAIDIAVVEKAER